MTYPLIETNGRQLVNHGKDSKTYVSAILRACQKPTSIALLTDFNTRMTFLNSFFSQRIFMAHPAFRKNLSLHFLINRSYEE
jgi:hypothetical protein